MSNSRSGVLLIEFRLSLTHNLTTERKAIYKLTKKINLKRMHHSYMTFGNLDVLCSNSVTFTAILIEKWWHWHYWNHLS